MSDMAKSLARMRINKATAALYLANESVSDARREVGALVGGKIHQNVATLEKLSEYIKREIISLDNEKGRDQCELDSTLMGILSREQKGKKRATKKGVR